MLQRIQQQGLTPVHSSVPKPSQTSPPHPSQTADASVSQKVGVDRAFVMRQARGIRAGGPQGEAAC